jgi:hypothetical protein
MRQKRTYEKPQVVIVDICPTSILAGSPLQSPGNTINTYEGDNQNYNGTMSW